MPSACAASSARPKPLQPSTTNIITIYEISEVAGVHFIAEEFIEGLTLRQKMMREKIPLSSALDVASQMASALTAAHQAGITHRDLKPENVMVRPDGYVKVLDFGLAKLTEGQAAPPPDCEAATALQALTNPGAVMGTRQYMSPEQARGLPVDSRSDLFSLGIVLYEMIAGGPPFTGRTAADLFVSILDKEPAPLTEHTNTPEIPAELDRLVSRCLKKDREQRYQSAQELLADLRQIAAAVSPQESAAETSLSIAVLPFINMSNDAQNEYFREDAAAMPLPEEVTIAKLPGNAKQTKSWLRPSALVGGFVILAALVMAAYSLLSRHQAQPSPITGPIHSLAVLPFRSLSAERRDEAFELGMADTLINRLSGLSKLTVRPISAVRKYTDLQQDAVVAGRELAVDTVLDGNIQLAGDQLRVTFRLVRVEDGVPLLSEKLDEKYTDIFTIQDAISERVTRALLLKLSNDESARLVKRYTENTDAYQLYMRGREFLPLISSASSLRLASS